MPLHKTLANSGSSLLLFLLSCCSLFASISFHDEKIILLSLHLIFIVIFEGLWWTLDHLINFIRRHFNVTRGIGVRTKRLKVAVVGLGYVGLPLA